MSLQVLQLLLLGETTATLFQNNLLHLPECRLNAGAVNSHKSLVSFPILVHNEDRLYAFKLIQLLNILHSSTVESHDIEEFKVHFIHHRLEAYTSPPCFTVHLHKEWPLPM